MTATVADLGNPATQKRNRRWPVYFGVILSLGLAAFTVYAVTDVQDSNNQLQTALTATGNRYGVTAEQIDGYATQIADQTGISKSDARREIALFIRSGAAPETWVSAGVIAARMDRASAH